LTMHTDPFSVCASHRIDEGVLRHITFSTPIKERISPVSLITSAKENMRKQGLKLNKCFFKHPNSKPSIIRKKTIFLLESLLANNFFFLVSLKRYIYVLGGHVIPAFSSLTVMGLKGFKISKFLVFIPHPIHSFLLNPPYSSQNNKKHNTENNTFFVMFGSGVVVK